jgi:hypothetical protein
MDRTPFFSVLASTLARLGNTSFVVRGGPTGGFRQAPASDHPPLVLQPARRAGFCFEKPVSDSFLRSFKK